MKISPRMVLFMALLALTPILGMTVYGAVASYRLYVTSAEFSPVSARVVERQDFAYLDETENRMRRVCLFRYAYSVDGTSYLGHRVTIGQDQTSVGNRSGLCQWISDLPSEGKRVIALVNLKSPETSIIIRSFPYSAIMNAVLMGFLWFALLILRLFSTKGL